jgi:Family of unknown function (DUF6632)
MAGWSWHPEGRSDHLKMIPGIDVTLGVFLLIASCDPIAHRSLIWFTVWSSLVHVLIMGVQSVTNPRHMAHLWGDVAALIVVAAVLAFLASQAAATERST